MKSACFRLRNSNIHIVLLCLEKKQNNSELATTSAKAAAAKKSPKFKKFRDNSKITSQRIRIKAAKRLSNNDAADKVAVRKLLRSIKRRQKQQLQNTISSTPKIPGSNLRRKLEFASAKKRKRKIASIENNNDQKLEKTNNVITKVTTSVDIEEGEIVSSDNEDDDDCVCIEPKVELITIDDDRQAKITTQSIKTTQSENKKNLVAVTSTPLEKIKLKNLPSSVHNSPTLTKTKANKVKEVVNDVVLFFEDVSRLNWLETINSDDTFSHYVKTTTPLGSDELPSRRSRRQRGIAAETIVKDELIILDDDTLKPELAHETKNAVADDSVIFVGEQTSNEFIPLVADDVPNPIKFVRNPAKPKEHGACDTSLFTKSEKKQLTKYNNNAYNPDAGEKPPKGKRMVIIDGSNVAFNHALNKEFSVKGLKICIEYFEKMGHEVKAVVPQFRLSRFKSTEPEELQALHRAGKIVFTPCKNLPGAKSSSYDDRFVLQIASELDAAIVSNDNYRDLINESPAMKKIIENRVIGYTWCNDIFMLPKDPYGRFGPTLHSILNR